MNSYIPKEGDYNSYYHRYIHHLGPDILQTLVDQKQTFADLLVKCKTAGRDHRYGPDKWSVLESMAHIVDTERIMAFRALCIARGEKTNLPGFDQDAYINDNDFSHLTLELVFEDFTNVRNATISLAQGFTPSQMKARGTASNSPVTTNALLYIIAGHYDHHVNIFENRYFI